MRIKTYLLVSIALCVCASAWAVDETGRGSKPALVTQIDSLLADEALKGGFQGIIVESLRDGQVWYERNPDLLFLPASNMKLLTSSAALNALGPDWRFRTELRSAGAIDKAGALRGDLYLKGSGDPLLGVTDLDRLVDGVRKAGIRKVAGRVIGDDSRFDKVRYGLGWSWDDMSDYYSAQISGLNLNENVVQVTVKPGASTGEPVRVSVSPPGYVTLDVRARTGANGSASAITITRPLGTNRILVEGSLPVDAKTEDSKPSDVTIDDPTRFAAFELAHMLREAGIQVTGGIAEGKIPAGSRLVIQVTSAPLGEIVRKMNKPSDNLIAECLLRTTGAEASKDKAGTVAAGRDAEMAWFKSIGIQPSGLDIADGSGLSRVNFVSPRTLATLLRTMATHRYGALWRDTLPIAGVDGTLRNRMKGTLAAGKVHAKTGYESSVSSLSGYVSTADGEPLLFVMLMNHHLARNRLVTGIQDRIAATLAGWTDAPPER